jgi:20S proteasome alpha/beta subunit
MTTIIGLKTDRGKKSNRGLLLGSDSTLTSTTWDDKGDIAYKVQTTHNTDKLYSNRSKTFVIGVTGTIDDACGEFFNKLLRNKFDLRKKVSDKKFPEFRELNLSRWNGRYPNLNEINEFLLATRFDNKTNLYHCWPLGEVEEIVDGVTIGSGSKYAGEAIKRKLQKDRKNLPYITMNYARKLMDEGLAESDKDIYSGGIDLIVVRPDKVIPFSAEIKKLLKASRKQIFDLVRDKSSLL